jgi:hypothetical protein
MFRTRVSRFRDRASFKSSEVIALFIISLFFGMVVFVVCWVGELVTQHFFGGH